MNLKLRKQKYIEERNKILDNPFKYFNPFYRKKLNKLDLKLDNIDKLIYQLKLPKY